MDLWIRSQSKQSLIKVENISLEIKKGNVIFITSGEWRLGTYKTKERALEVLDEIQDKMDKGSFAKVKNGLGETTSYVACPLITYEMPEE